MTDADELHQDIARYLATVDVARTPPLELSLGYGPPLMLDAYPCVDGVWAHRRSCGAPARVAAYTKEGRAG